MPKCNIVDCELPHCKRCGQHYSPEEGDMPRECGNCALNRISDITDKQTEAFGGNWEEAARWFDW